MPIGLAHRTGAICLRAACGLMLALASAMPGSADSPECARLPGTFIQLTNTQAAWSAAPWRTLFGEFQRLGIANLFAQWTVLHDTAFFPTSEFRFQRPRTLQTLADLAVNTGVRVWIGLHLDARYWDEINRGADRVESYFDGRQRELKRFIRDLDAAIDPSWFAGWYITDEIDDQTWHDAAKRTALKRYLAATIALLKELRPGANVAVSGFTNASSEPASVAAFWSDIAMATKLDLLLFQDGVGEGKLELNDVPKYYAALAQALRGTNTRVGGVAEFSRLLPNGTRVPATPRRIREQLAMAARLLDFPPVAFSVPDYMSEVAGPQAGALLSHFVADQSDCPR
jgi:uncharacterized protein DUF4434